MTEIVAPAAPQEAEPHEGFCPFCGRPYSSRAVFCGSCGKRLPTEEAAGSSDNVPAPTVVSAQRADILAEALPKAGIPRRMVAFLIDFALIFVAAVIVEAVTGDTAGNTTALILFLGAPIYMIAFECSNLGATPGKLALGIRVVNDAGMRIGIGQAIGRTLLSVLNYFFFFAGFWMAGFRQDGRALNDLGSSTWVVRKERVG